MHLTSTDSVSTTLVKLASGVYYSLNILDHSSSVDCIFIDFAKSFDTVSHQLLLFTLSKLNVDTNVVKWIECFLSNQTHYVKLTIAISTVFSSKWCSSRFHAGCSSFSCL